MAKFAIAFCILLVACGTQGWSLSSIASEISSVVETIIEKINASQASLSAGLTNATSVAETYVEKINTTVQEALDDWETIEEQMKTKYEDASSCISSSVNVTAVAEEIRSNLTSCVQTFATKLSSDYESLVTALQNATTVVYTVTESAESCMSNMLTELSCLYKLWKQVESEYSVQWSELIANGTTLISDLYNFGTTLESCGLTTASETIINEELKALDAIQACVANSTSSD